MASRQMNKHRYCLTGSPVSVFPEITFGSTGTPTIVTTSESSMGVKAIVQALAASSKYVLSLEDTYVRLRNATGSLYDQVATTWSTFWLLARDVGGSVCIVSCSGVTTADAVTIKVPGSSAVTLTAVAYNATLVKLNDTFCVGHSANATQESAYNLAAVINNKGNASYGSTNGDGGSTDMPSTVTAYADGVDGGCVIRCSVPGMTVCSTSATTLSVVGPTTATVNVPMKCYPGIVMQFGYGITAGCPASGDRLKAELVLENASRKP